jgi:4a-hydroxytetrahydrobiopterin dehydratase
VSVANEVVAMSLAEKTCLPCRGGVPPMSREDFEPLLAELQGWQVVEDRKLFKSFSFKNFAGAMRLANEIAQVAEEQRHHPDLLVRWGELRVELWTHAADGLTESDFILAAKIDRITASL